MYIVCACPEGATGRAGRASSRPSRWYACRRETRKDNFPHKMVYASERVSRKLIVDDFQVAVIIGAAAAGALARHGGSRVAFKGGSTLLLCVWPSCGCGAVLGLG